MTYDDLLSNEPIRAEIDVQIGDGSVHIVYDAARVSAMWLQRAVTTPRKALAEIIIGWDVTDREGNPILGASVEEWERIFEPISIRAVIEPIVHAIIDDWRGGGKA